MYFHTGTYMHMHAGVYVSKALAAVETPQTLNRAPRLSWKPEKPYTLQSPYAGELFKGSFLGPF